MLHVFLVAIALMGGHLFGDVPAGLTAKAEIKPVGGSQVSGTVTFTAEAGGVRVSVNVDGLTEGSHGFHIHEFADCNAPGAHFNPTNQIHGAPWSEKRHVGDLGNILADANGHGYYNHVDKVIKLDGPNSIIGKTVVIDAEPDDFTTQPSGNSGAAQACGVIYLN